MAGEEEEHRPLKPNEILHLKYGELYADRNVRIAAAHLWGIPPGDEWWHFVPRMLRENWPSFRDLIHQSLSGGGYITCLYSEKL